MARMGLRLARALVFATASVLLSAGARLAVTGRPLPTDLLLLAFAATCGVVLLLSSAERGYWSIAAVLVPLQLGSNALFNAGQVSCPPGTTAPHGAAGWGVLACGGGDVRPGLLGLDAPAHALPALGAGALLVLLAVHLAMALIAAWWLRAGEAALFTLLRTVAMLAVPVLTGLLARLFTPLPVLVPRCWLPTRPEPRRLTSQDALRGAASRRGPPLLRPAG